MPALASRLLALAAALSATALAGCGPFGGDDGASEEQFVADGDAICREARDWTDDLQGDLPETAKQQAEFTEDLLAIFEDELAELQTLEPPADREEAFSRYLRARQRAIGYVEDGLGAAKAGNALAYADAQARVADEQVERTKLAERSGFSECSRPLSGGDDTSE